MRRRLLWLNSLRVAIVTVLLGAGVLVQIRARTTWTGEPFFLLLGLVYALTIQYTEQRRWLIDLQFGIDTGLVSVLVLMTGGVTSFFSSLYVLPILAASTVLDRQAGLLVGFLSSVLYMGVVLAQYTGTVGLADGAVAAAQLPPISVALYTTSLGVFGFIAVAGLSGHLAERLHRADIRLDLASTQLADLQAFNQDVIESLTCGLITTDAGGRILTFNQSAERITGRTASDAVSHALSDILPLPDGIRDQLAADISANRQFEVVYPRPTGDPSEIAVTAAPLLTPSGQAGCLFVFDDVTHARQLERESRVSQRLAAVGELAAGLAHEIRNPLAAMSGSHDLATSTPFDSILHAWSARPPCCFVMTPSSASTIILMSMCPKPRCGSRPTRIRYGRSSGTSRPMPSTRHTAVAPFGSRSAKHRTMPSF